MAKGARGEGKMRIPRTNHPQLQRKDASGTPRRKLVLLVRCHPRSLHFARFSSSCPPQESQPPPAVQRTFKVCLAPDDVRRFTIPLGLWVCASVLCRDMDLLPSNTETGLAVVTD